MRIVALSDTHGSLAAVQEIYRAQRGADYFIHLGDGYAQARRMRELHPEMPLLAVTGNCDRSETDSDTKLLTLEDGTRILYTHGHRFHVKFGLDELIDAAEGMGASAAFFGHTHEPFCRRLGEVWYINPGRAAEYDGLRFATLDIQNGVLIPNLARIPREPL